MRVGEMQAFAREPVQVWRLDVLGTVATDVTVADIVGHDDDYVGEDCFGGECRWRQTGAGNKCDQRGNDDFHVNAFLIRLRNAMILAEFE